ncbi:hypothetical protein MPH_08858 [Macrophomina phaseolina MS6]|uniref:Uncharacterized protein n=1 Tax=Macrophomina phaseolina (strain MS6) TaxID=1126212 RepID=K2RUY2_MACPH|nr:hypothetical protein MPH_08858 [Macrophomina phaseolina MS6]
MQTWRKTVRGWSALKKNRQCVAPVLWEEDGDGDIRVLANAAVPAIVKTTQDGKIILNPQPSDHPEDLLNWRWREEHLVFGTMLLPAFLTDFGITYGAVTFEKQANTWDMSVSAVSNSISGALFMLGPGGNFALPLTERYGR